MGIASDRCTTGDPQHEDSYSIWPWADPQGRMGCVRAASNNVASHPRIYEGETETYWEKQRVRKKKAWEELESPGRKRGEGNDRDSDVISIRSRGERIFPAVYSCSRWVDGGKWATLDFNPIRRNRLKVRVVRKLLEEVRADLQVEKYKKRPAPLVSWGRSVVFSVVWHWRSAGLLRGGQASVQRLIHWCESQMCNLLVQKAEAAN